MACQPTTDNSMCAPCAVWINYNSPWQRAKLSFWSDAFSTYDARTRIQESAIVSNGKRGEPNDTDVRFILRLVAARPHATTDV